MPVTTPSMSTKRHRDDRERRIGGFRQMREHPFQHERRGRLSRVRARGQPDQMRTAADLARKQGPPPALRPTSTRRADDPASWEWKNRAQSSTW